jgi:putative heme iron utilization protein
MDAKDLARASRSATLATLTNGAPYASLVAVGWDGLDPVLLVSELAEHTKNLWADPRASLLLVEPGDGDPLARARVTLLGALRPDETARAPFLAAHPDATYAALPDFHAWRMTVESARWIGGFGRMSWLDWR